MDRGEVREVTGNKMDDLEEMESGQVREEIVIGNACGGKPRSHGSKAALLSHAFGV